MQWIFFGSGPVAHQSFKTLSKVFNFDYVVTKTTTKHSFSTIVDSQKIVTADNKQQLDDILTTIVDKNSIGILIDYGVILSKQSIRLFSHGIINSHFSLLPKLRGADPITHAILGGHSLTGVSLMLVNSGLDTGDILAQTEVEIGPKTNSKGLTNKLISASNAMLEKIIPLYLSEEIVALPQEKMSIQPTYTQKISKQDGIVDFSKISSTQLDKKVRALIGWPGTKTKLGEVNVTIENGFLPDQNPDYEFEIQSGDILKTKHRNQKILQLVCADSQIYNVTDLKPDGKKSMSAEAFLAGYSSRINLKN